MAFFECGGIRLLLSRPETPEFDHPASILYYQVADIHAARASIGALGATFHGEPHLVARLPGHDLWMAFFRDSEENVLGLMSEVPRAE
jgi:methylmalonyl-CoA/ethylmalonyl-CoA epimerase